jgi:hypothetical protein
MAKTTSKITFSTEMVQPELQILRKAMAARDDLPGFIASLGGIRCRNRKELDVATDTLLLEGAILKTAPQMDSLMRKARKAGLALHTAAA